MSDVETYHRSLKKKCATLEAALAQVPRGLDAKTATLNQDTLDRLATVLGNDEDLVGQVRTLKDALAEAKKEKDAFITGWTDDANKVDRAFGEYGQAIADELFECGQFGWGTHMAAKVRGVLDALTEAQDRLRYALADNEYLKKRLAEAQRERDVAKENLERRRDEDDANRLERRNLGEECDALYDRITGLECEAIESTEECQRLMADIERDRGRYEALRVQVKAMRDLLSKALPGISRLADLLQSGETRCFANDFDEQAGQRYAILGGAIDEALAALVLERDNGPTS